MNTAEKQSLMVVELAVEIYNTPLWKEKMLAVPPFSGKESERSDGKQIRENQIRRDHFSKEFDHDIAIWGIIMSVQTITDQRCPNKLRGQLLTLHTLVLICCSFAHNSLSSCAYRSNRLMI